MEWHFSLGWFFGGLLTIIIGALIVVFYQKIADNLANGISSYEKTKLVGVITIIVGLLMMTNIFTLILYAIFSALFKR